MDIDVFRKNELDTVFRVLRTALSSEGALEARERLFLQTYARITGYTLSSDPLPIVPGAARVKSAHSRKRLVQLAAMAVLLAYPLKPGSFVFLRDLAGHLGVRDSVVEVVAAVLQGKRIKTRMLAARRIMRVMLKEQYLSGGTMALVRFFGVLFFGVAVDKAKHVKYKRLGLLPEGTLGREYWKHMTRIGFGFPGEPGGIPDAAAFHDIGHVLADNDTTPLGEIQQASFQGGNRREDGFAFVQFGILQFHQGIQLTPIAPPEVGNFDPEEVLWAIHRGAKCRVDITHQWDYWPLMPLSLEEARAKCGLLPKLDRRGCAARPAFVSSEIRAPALETAG
jgi:hypothetical protein